MKRPTIDALVGTGCLHTFIPSLVSGFAIYLVLPSGGDRRNSGETIFGIDRLDRVNIHNSTSLLFAAVLIIHLLLYGTFFRHVENAPGESAGALQSSGVTRIQHGMCINKAEQGEIIYGRSYFAAM
jgi:ABC-type uncharacterized transport system permease subunit